MSIGYPLEISGVKFQVHARTSKQMDKISGGKFVGQISTETMKIDIDCVQNPQMALLTFLHEVFHLPSKLLSDFPELTEDQLDYLSLMVLSLYDQLPGIKEYLEKNCAKMRPAK